MLLWGFRSVSHEKREEYDHRRSEGYLPLDRVTNAKHGAVNYRNSADRRSAVAVGYRLVQNAATTTQAVLHLLPQIGSFRSAIPGITAGVPPATAAIWDVRRPPHVLRLTAEPLR